MEGHVSKISRRRAIGMLVTAGAAGFAALQGAGPVLADDDEPRSIEGRLIASGIPGASSVCAVGVFLPGGPIHDTPALAAFTQPCRVLDPTRVLVSSRSNFGAPVANADQQEGSILSIDPTGRDTLAVPAQFAVAGNQAPTLGGAVQLYSAQSPNFRNGLATPGAVTASQTAVSNPLGLSINNAFGRLWPANAPYGLDGPGSSTIDDPDGAPLVGAPNPTTGGVYFGSLTGRQPAQVIPGSLSRAAVGTAFLGRSPDGSTKAVFCVIVADGSIVQEHTLKGLDGLAPHGTVRPLDGRSWSLDLWGDEDDPRHPERRVTPRLGALLNYTPQMILYVSQPFDHSILALSLTVGGPTGSEVFVPSGRRLIRTGALNQPVDLAPVDVEAENPNWASNTTMEEGSDLYVCNRGNGTIARIRQDGTLVAVRQVHFRGRSLGDARLNGIGTSPDGSRVWVTYVGSLPGDRGPDGGVIEVPAF